MDIICEQVIEGIHEILPESEGIELAPESILGELPEWDSMVAVNLQTYLREHLGIEVPLELLADETTIEEIAAYLRSPVGSEAAQSFDASIR